MISRPVLRRLVELACLAPSVHNTQPWQWRTTTDGVRLYADRRRQLPVEDPRGRNLVISCGAALDHLRVAAEALGLRAEVVRFPSGEDRDLLAEVVLRRGQPAADAAATIALLRARCTDRRRFTSWPVPEGSLDLLVDAARGRGTAALAVTDPGLRFRLERLAHEAQDLRSADRAARREQRHWIGERGADGIPVAVLPDVRDEVSSRFGPGAARETRSVVESTDGVVILGGMSDTPRTWLSTGEGLSALWLLASREGLSVVPLSLPIEVVPVRLAVRELVEHELVPHLLLRVGWQAIGRSELPRTPRRSVDDVLR